MQTSTGNLQTIFTTKETGEPQHNDLIQLTIYGSKMNVSKLYTSLTAKIKQVKLINNFQRTRKPSTGKHFSLDSEDDYHLDFQKVSHQYQLFSQVT